jgi:hypothetical protein
MEEIWKRPLELAKLAKFAGIFIQFMSGFCPPFLLT